MTAEELQTLLSIHAPQVDSSISPEKLPDMLWARLYRAFSAYLFERSGVIDFFHGQLKEAVGKRYLEMETDRNVTHRTIADYFENRWQEPYIRAVAELPHQRVKAADWDGAEGILTNLRFIEAKCTAAMTYDLIADYNSTLQHLPNSPLSEYVNFISPRAAFLAEYPHECLAEVASELDTSDSTVLQIVEARRTLEKSNRSWLEKVVGKHTIGSWLTEPTTAIAFSPDGSVVLTAHDKGKVLIWQRDNWRLRTIHSLGNSGIIRLHVFDDNLHYLIVPSYGEMQIASIETGLTIEKFGDLWDADAAYVAGNTLLVVNRKGGALWSLKTPKPYEILTDKHPNLLPYWAGLNGVGISRDRGLWDLTTAQRKGTINLKSVPDEYEWREHIFGSIIPYCLLTYDVAIHVGESLTVHSQPSGKVKEEYNLNNVVSKPYGYRVGALVTIGHMRKIVVVWKHGGQVMQVINLSKHQSESIQFKMHIHAVEFDPEENSIFVCLADNKLVFRARHHSLRIFSSETLQELPAPPCLPSSESDILLSSDGSLAFSEKKELYETETGRVHAVKEIPDKIWTNPRGAAPFIGFIRDSGYLTLYKADGSTETLVKLSQAPTKARISVGREVIAFAEGKHGGSSVTIFRGSRIGKHNIDKHGDGLSVDLSPKGKWFLAAINLQSSIGPTYGYSLCLLDTENGRVVRSNRQILSFINMAIFIPNSMLVGVAFADGSVQIRKMPNLEVFWSNKFHVGNIRKISASPDGLLLATVGMDQKLIITRVSQGEAIAAKPFGFTPLDCEFTSARQLVLAAPGNQFFKYKIHV